MQPFLLEPWEAAQSAESGVAPIPFVPMIGSHSIAAKGERRFSQFSMLAVKAGQAALLGKAMTLASVPCNT